ncbi:response regulator [Psychroflexus sp. ALD_RP9]|uniref:response regulator n=1 Tax=Psychroflexus sp. ALD_RP9 TaxID=2777186 RepID=UPI001A90A4E4|nr:response regulator [Psychroflexus sp. ALD_RP9]QSS98108.1 response regulator transcription factor [Psychroflexus sp. ALD_RP9]
MLKPYTILIIDDHPLIVEAYKTAIKQAETQQNQFQFKVTSAEDADQALAIINQFKQQNSSPDLVILDIKIPPSSDGKILSGEDLAPVLKATFNNLKLIVSTTFNNNYRLNSILKQINPDGLLVKNDITSKTLEEAMITVINQPPFYSKTVLQLLRKTASNNYLIDEIDRRLLYEISIGTRMNELPDVINLSKAALEKRKRNLKEVFKVQNNDDRSLIIQAKKEGYV